MADKFPAMLSYKFNIRRVKEWPVAVEPKLDGMRCILILKNITDDENGSTGFSIAAYSRIGKMWHSLQHVEDALCDTYAETSWTEDLVFDGEIFCGDFKTTTSQVKKKTEQAPDAVLTVFDVLPLSEWDEEGESSLEYHERRQKLYQFFECVDPKTTCIQMSKAVLAHNLDEINDLYAESRKAGHEGVIVKACTGALSHWTGKRSYGWMKIKEQNTADCEIIGAEEGTGKYEGTLGNLIVKYKDNEVGVGTGLTDVERDKFWSLWQKGKLKGIIVEVSYHEETPDQSLRHPVFKTIRIDKSKGD